MSDELKVKHIKYGDELIEHARDVGITAGKLRALANFMERKRKHVLARLIMDQHRSSDKKLSEARAETQARATDSYKAHLEAQQQAEEQASAAEEEKWAAKNALEMMRSHEATERAEMNAYGRDPRPSSEPQWTPDERVEQDRMEEAYG